MASMIQKDPTRTAMIRRKFLAEMKQRFAKLKSAIWQLVAVEDCFGLRRPSSPLEALLNNNRFAFDTDAEKIKKFRIWLQEQVAAGILTVPPGGDPQQAWMSKYLFLAYRQGVTQAYAIGRPDSSTPSDLDSLTQSVFLDSMFNGPIGTRQLELLATRAFEELDGITKGMSGDMARILSDGFVRGDNPAKIARELVKGVEGIERKRALMLARTELIHAHAEGSLDSLEALGYDEVTAMVEWTAEDDACELCSDLVGVTLTIAQARGLIPRHPNCVVGETQVCAPDVLAVMAVEYTGKIFELITATGRSLSVTANHILLTQRGWVFAKDITNRDYLINSPLVNAHIFTPNDDLTHPNISQVFRSLVESGNPFRVANSLNMPEYFHGDGKFIQSEIQIIDMQGKLLGIWDSPLIQELCQQGLIPANIAKFVLSSFGSLDLFLNWLATSSDSLMGRLGISDVLRARSVLHYQPVSFPDSSNRDRASGFDNSSNFFSGNTQSFTNAVQTDFGRVEFENFLHHNRVVISSIVSHDVVSLPVYDVSTQSSLYSANGFITSNCRCAWLPAPFKEPGQKRGRRAQIAIDRSLRAEGRKGDSLKEARARSKWAGADLRIAITKEQKARKRKALKAARRKKTRGVR